VPDRPIWWISRCAITMSSQQVADLGDLLRTFLAGLELPEGSRAPIPTAALKTSPDQIDVRPMFGLP
jgi:hypothetical protein